MTGNRKKVVLVVGMLDSVHLGRWLRLQRDPSLRFILFPSGANRRLHPEIRQLIADPEGPQFDVVAHHRYISLLLAPLSLFLGLELRGILLGKAISKLQPEIIHLAEIQNAGYLYLKSSAGKQKSWHLIVSNYGSDIFWFGREKKHRIKIRELLSETDSYSCECERDLELSTQFGFEGDRLILAPNSGGIRDSMIADPEDSHDRNGVVIKGYQNWSGMGLMAIHAVHKMRQQLRNRKITVYSAGFLVQTYCWALNRFKRSNIRVFAKHSLTHGEVLRLFFTSEIYLGVSKTDGISTSVLEAMSQGCVPVQSATSCAADWFLEGRTGVSIETNDTTGIANAILSAIELVDGKDASTENLRIIKERYSVSKLEQQLQHFYFPERR